MFAKCKKFLVTLFFSLNRKAKEEMTYLLPGKRQDKTISSSLQPRFTLTHRIYSLSIASLHNELSFMAFSIWIKFMHMISFWHHFYKTIM